MINNLNLIKHDGRSPDQVVNLCLATTKSLPSLFPPPPATPALSPIYLVPEFLTYIYPISVE